MSIGLELPREPNRTTGIMYLNPIQRLRPDGAVPFTGLYVSSGRKCTETAGLKLDERHAFFPTELRHIEDRRCELLTNLKFFTPRTPTSSSTMSSLTTRALGTVPVGSI
jgi:hypothetical protein